MVVWISGQDTGPEKSNSRPSSENIMGSRAVRTPKGYIKFTSRKTLRRSRPHGLRGKRIEPTVKQGLQDIEDDVESSRQMIEEYEDHDRWDFLDDWAEMNTGRSLHDDFGE